MSGIKIVLILGVALIGTYFFIRLRNSLFEFLLILILIVTAIVFILFPDLTNKLASKLGVSRGADLIFYVSIIIFWFVILKLYSRIRRLEQTVTKVVRDKALEEVNQTPN
jgi:small membrane protein